MQPSAEALAWQQRADAWATQAESQEDQAVEPASRWSDAAATDGRPTYPADGVGWRTETAEWRATSGARWRQTTEWRSTTGSHGWRSTTEAWQTNGNDSYPPAAETSMSQPAISSTPWTPSDTPSDPDAEARPAWQQATDSSNEPFRADAWQSQETPTWRAQESQSWQTPEPSSWQQPTQRAPAESSASWQQLAEPTSTSTPSWRSNAIEGTATWTDTSDTRSASGDWGRGESTGTPSWQTPRRDDGRHLVREDDRAAWRRGADIDPGDSSPQIGRRRAPESPSGGTGWSGRSDAGDWAGYTDTGNISLYPDPDAESPSWGDGRYTADPVSAPATRPDEPTGRRALPATPYQQQPAEPGRRRRRREEPPPLPRDPYADSPRSRRADEVQGAAQTGYATARRGRYAEETPGPEVEQRGMPQRGGRRRAAEEPVLTPEPTDRRTYAAEPPPAPAQPAADGPSKGRARYNQTRDDWREHTGSWEAEPDTSSWTRDPDTGQWSRSDDDPRVLAWRAEAARREAVGRPSTGQRELPAAPARHPQENATNAAAGGNLQGGDEAPYGSAPTSSMPYGGGPPPQRRALPSAPASAMPDYGTPGPAPRSAMPADGRRGSGGQYSDAPMPAQRSAMPDGGRRSGGAYSEAPMPAPRSAMPADTRPGADSYSDAPAPRNGTSDGGRYGGNPYAEAPGAFASGAGTNPYDTPGPAPRSAMPDGGRRNGNPYNNDFGTPPTSAITGGGRRSRDAPGSAPRSAMPDDGWQGGGNAYGEPSDGRRNGSNPYDGEFGAPPQRALPDGRGRTGNPYDASGSAWPDRALPAGNEPGPAPRSGTPYGAAPRSGTPYGVAQAGSIAPRSAPGYGAAASASAPRSGIPGSAPRIGAPGNAPRSGIPGGTRRGGPEDPYRGSGGPEDPYRTSAGAETPYRNGGGPEDPYRTSGGSEDPYRISGGPGASPYRTGAGPDDSYRTGAGPDDPYRTGAGPGAPYRTGAGLDDPSRNSSGRRRAPDDLPPAGGRRPAPGPYGDAPGQDDWRRDPEPTADRQNRRPGQPGERPRDPAEDRSGNGWPNAPARGGWQNGGRQDGLSSDWRAELDQGPPAATPDAELNGWQQEPAWQRDEAARGGPAYRDGAEKDWRQDLSDRSDLAEGESRRYGTSDYAPFRSGGSAAAAKSNLSSTSTSMNSPVPREQREAQARPPRTSNGYQGLSGSYERRAMSGGFPMSRRSNLLDPDDEEDEPETGGPLAAVGYTVIWYGVPVVLFLVYMLVTGSQSQAISTLTKAAPQFGISLVLSVLIAIGIRWVSDSWKSISVGLAAAVVGGGLATVISSAITGNSLS